MRVLGLIPARGGSKGIARKNLADLNGKPLLAYTIEAARAAERLSHVVVSTEDEEIARVTRALGVEVLDRPIALAADETPTFPVVAHAVEAFPEFDSVCLLQPTSPLRVPGVIDGCIETFESSGADCVFTVLPVPSRYNPHWVYLGSKDGTLTLATGEHEPVPRRQDLPKAFHREGSVYVSRAAVIRAGSLYGRKIVGYPVDPERSVNVDAPEDLARAEDLLR